MGREEEHASTDFTSGDRATNASRQLNVPRHQSYSFGMNGAEVAEERGVGGGSEMTRGVRRAMYSQHTHAQHHFTQQHTQQQYTPPHTHTHTTHPHTHTRLQTDGPDSPPQQLATLPMLTPAIVVAALVQQSAVETVL